jgi:hypothetical protein
VCDRTSDPYDSPAEVVQAKRFELVDDFGVVPAVLGNLTLEADEDFYPGLSLRSAEGIERVALLVHPGGPDLEFIAAGNVVAAVGHMDIEGSHPDPGTRLVLCDSDGRPVVGWKVDSKGEAVDLRRR